MPIDVECWHKSDCCRVEMNLATLTCWGYCQILNIGVSFSLFFCYTFLAFLFLSVFRVCDFHKVYKIWCFCPLDLDLMPYF